MDEWELEFGKVRAMEFKEYRLNLSLLHPAIYNRKLIPEKIWKCEEGS